MESITRSLRGRTYAPSLTTTSHGLGRLDEDRADSMTDEGGPVLQTAGPGERSLGRKAIAIEQGRPDSVAAARTAFEQSAGLHGPARAASWYWDLASGRMEWDERLTALFGYAEKVTDAAWRENRIHPEDRDRVKASLERATIVNQGTAWSDQYRFLQADGSYATVTERAFVLQDDAGPRGVLGAITPTPTVAEGMQARTEEVGAGEIGSV